MEKYLKPTTLELFSKVSSLEHFKRANIMYSAIIHANTNTIINKLKDTPKFPEDWWAYSVLRAHTKSWIVSAKILRDEDMASSFDNDIDFMGAEDIENYFYRSKKNLLVLSKGKCDFDGLNFLGSKYTDKYYITNYKGNHERIVGVENLNNLKEAVDFCMKNFNNPLPLLFDAGPTTLKEVLKEEPILDFILITQYYGELDSKFIGNPFPMELIEQKYNLIKQVKLENINKGYLVFKTFVKH
jgi:hypothetical protein